MLRGRQTRPRHLLYPKNEFFKLSLIIHQSASFNRADINIMFLSPFAGLFRDYQKQISS